MAEITASQLQATIIVIGVIFAALITLDKVIDVIKKWRQPASNIQDKLAADKNRQEIHERQILNLTKMVNALCKAEVAHLTHELTGTGADELRDALTLLTNSTIDRIT